ncbi:histidinol-phosphate transaminase [Spirochaeta dissipatitropha]
MVHQAIDQVQQELEVYPDGRGTSLVRKLSEIHSISQDRIILGNGSDDIMIMAAASFIDPGSNSVMPTPSFSQYEFAVRLYGGDVRKVPLKDGNHDLDSMLEAIDENTRIMWICNPNNPTGTYRNHNDIHDFLSKIPGRILVVLDEAYSEYAEAEDYPDSRKFLDEFSNLLVLHTFSKIHGIAALRLGYGFADSDIINCFLRVKQPFNVNGIALAAGEAALNDSIFVKHSLEINQSGMRYLSTELDRLGYTYYPSQANFICIHTPITADQAYTRLMDFGITIRSLSSFGLDHSIRVSIGEMQALQSLVRGLEAIMHEHTNGHTQIEAG